MMSTVDVNKQDKSDWKKEYTGSTHHHLATRLHPTIFDLISYQDQQWLCLPSYYPLHLHVAVLLVHATRL